MKEKNNKETFDDQIEGRNAVLELLNSNKDINKIFVQNGEKHGSINKIIAMAKESKIVVVEAQKSKLDEMSNTKNHNDILFVLLLILQKHFLILHHFLLFLEYKILNFLLFSYYILMFYVFELVQDMQNYFYI